MFTSDSGDYPLMDARLIQFVDANANAGTGHG
jgi:hypothetical protein